MKTAALEAIELVVARESDGTRLDRFAADAAGVSRTEAQRWIEHGRVTIGGAVRGGSSKVRTGERVVVRPEVPAATAALPDPDVRFDVMHVDDDLVVLNKPAGLVVHPAHGHASGTLVNGLLALGLFRREELARMAAPDVEGDREDADERGGEDVGDAGEVAARGAGGDHARPGIVHRLDKGTSGVMVVARTAEARDGLKGQFQAHSIERVYEAIALGIVTAGTRSTLHGRDPRDRLRFTTRVARGKLAVTHVRVLQALQGATRVECTLETGRTHQIRVHLAEGGTPVLGDPLYGRPAKLGSLLRALADDLGHQALHARVLGFDHPRTGARVRFEAPPPEDFQRALASLG